MLSRAFKRPFSTCRALRNVASTSEAASSSTSSRGRSENHPELDPETKRKLISLYHESASFITPEVLSNYIDAEFTRSYSFSKRLENGYNSLQRFVEAKREFPKMTTINNSFREPAMFDLEMEKESWSGERGGRDLAVKAALYGVDKSLGAGLETVEEYRSSLPPRERKSSSSGKRRGS